jgi:hypothetical protein
MYLVEGDILMTPEHLHRYYAELYPSDGALIVQWDQMLGDNRWDDVTKWDLSYCVSTAFANYQWVVDNMAVATASWNSAANIRIHHVPAEDAGCELTGGNAPNVIFRVRPNISSCGNPGASCSFGGPWDRPDGELGNVYFTTSGPLTLKIMRHELGHVLGFHHEHIRTPETNCSGESWTYRVLTEFDTASIMYYGSCPNYNGSSDLSTLDRLGVGLLYGKDNEPTGSMVTPRAGHTATLLDNGKVLIAGGYALGSYSGSVDSAELYDPATGQFTETGRMNARRARHAATRLPNGTVLIVGGGDSRAELYDPILGTFALTIGSVAYPHGYPTTTVLSGGTLNGQVLVAGGQEWGGPAELYNPATQAFWWDPPPYGNMREDRAGHTATLLNNGKVLLAGGYNGSSDVGSAELFDPTTKTFTMVGSMNGPNGFGMTATRVNSGNVLLAGYGGTSVYVPGSGFTGSTPMVHARFEHTAALLPNGKVLIAGGRPSWGRFPEASMEVYDPGTGSFAAITQSMTTVRSAHTATLLGNGMILIVGGQTGTSAWDGQPTLRTAELALW